MLTILDTISLSGFEDRPNEDRFGFVESAAFVIDGATGLGDPLLTGPGGSDAAWIADFAALGFENTLSRGGSFADAVRAVNADVANLVRLCAPDAPDWAAPIAAFQGVAWRNGRVEAAGLGDCTLIVVDKGGRARRATGIEGANERERAETQANRAAVSALDGRQLYELPEVKERLRVARARFNKPGQPTWTLGREPRAADHIAHFALRPERPAYGLLATDGFMALADTYGLFTPAGLAEAAYRDGLEPLGRMLRDTERNVDPDCARWPRYKVSDDATAAVFKVD